MDISAKNIYFNKDGICNFCIDFENKLNNIKNRKYNLDNLIVIVDRNDLQITGKTEDVNPIEPIDKKFKSFGFETISTNGNNISDLLYVFQHVPVKENKPTVIIAKTTKGSGVSFIENQINWHHKVPSKDEYESAISELNEKLNSYE